MLRTEIWTADIGTGVESLGQSEISRDMSEIYRGLNTDPRRIQAEGGGREVQRHKEERVRDVRG